MLVGSQFEKNELQLKTKKEKRQKQEKGKGVNQMFVAGVSVSLFQL